MNMENATTLLNNEDIIEAMYIHIQPVLEEAEDIYQKILLSNRNNLFGKRQDL